MFDPKGPIGVPVDHVRVSINVGRDKKFPKSVLLVTDADAIGLGVYESSWIPPVELSRKVNTSLVVSPVETGISSTSEDWTKRHLLLSNKVVCTLIRGIVLSVTIPTTCLFNCCSMF